MEFFKTKDVAERNEWYRGDPETPTDQFITCTTFNYGLFMNYNDLKFTA